MTGLRPPTLLALLGAVALAVGACASAGAPSAVATPSPSPVSTHDPNAPIGTVRRPTSGDPGAFDPSHGRTVVPKPGQLDVHPVPAQTLTAAVTGRHVMVTVDYTSGVEPCNILDSIDLKAGVQSFEITLREGHGPEPVACIAIAEFRRAIVDLGELAPGTYRISDGTGVAAPINVSVA